ncbi:MAG: ATP synthase F1 subunit delta [Janthinobacterium lividum]
MAVVDLRYARALDEVVIERKLSRDAVKVQLESFLGTLGQSAQLREVLENPSIEADQKLRLLDALAARLGMDRTVRNFVAVIVDHLRLQELPQIIQAYLQIADRDNGIAEAEITSARPLDETGKRVLEASIAQLTGDTSVRAVYKEDPTLLGGAVIRVGSTVYDGSVRGQLEQMKRRMFAAV